MKKILMIFTSIFILVNIAFAQNYQHKIDSLQNEKSKAEKAKLIADKNLRENLTQENYEAVRKAKGLVEKIDSNIRRTVAEQQAEAKAKAEKEKAEAQAKAKAEDEAALALYKKKFPAFEYVGVKGPFKEYMLENLKKDTNWDIINISPIEERSVVTAEGYGTLAGQFEYEYYYTTYVRSTNSKEYVRVSFQSGDISKIKKFALTLEKAWYWHKNPDEFYLAMKALQKMQTDIVNFYKGFTGEEDDQLIAFISKNENQYPCTDVDIYYSSIPKGEKCYQFDTESNKVLRKEVLGDVAIFITCMDDYWNTREKPNRDSCFRPRDSRDKGLQDDWIDLNLKKTLLKNFNIHKYMQ